MSYLYRVESTLCELKAESCNFVKLVVIGTLMDLQSCIPNLCKISTAYFHCVKKISRGDFKEPYLFESV